MNDNNFSLNFSFQDLSLFERICKVDEFDRKRPKKKERIDRPKFVKIKSSPSLLGEPKLNIQMKMLRPRILNRQASTPDLH
jgi:hypothetical protein